MIQGGTQLKTRAPIALGIAVFLLAAVVPSAAVAATPKCFGKPATIVSNSGTITGTKKDDVIVSTARTGALNVINGKGGDDLICGGRATDFVFGGPGNDKLKGGGGSDYLAGSTGNDHLYGDGKDGGSLDLADYELTTNGVSVNFQTDKATGEGTDTLHANIDGVWGSPFDDSIIGDGNTQFIWSGGGNDTINAGGGLDLVTPGDGDDNVNGGNEGADEANDLDIFYVNDSTGPTTVDLGAGTATGAGIGTDQVTDFENVVGSNFNDTITGDEVSNILFGGRGNDSLRGGQGFDYAAYWFAASAVNANLQTRTSTGATTLDAEGNDLGEGTDSFLDLEGLLGTINFADTLVGDNQANYIDGDGGNDTLSGGGGDDWFVGGLGSDTVDGGAGSFDFWDYYGGEAVSANLGTGTITTPSIQLSVTGLEAVAGANENDTLIGDANDNYFYGWNGNDTIDGAAGNDQIDGGGGTNTVNGGPGTDICHFASIPTSCESDVEVPVHPLQAEAASITALRRNF